jgi:hypothetical protein
MADVCYSSDLTDNASEEIQPAEPRCPRCFSLDVVPSLPKGIVDELMGRMGRIPRHCRACAKRFYMRTPQSLAK